MNTPKLSPHAVHLLKGVKEKILKEPELYDQSHWITHTTCGTVCCIAGHLAVGHVPERRDDFDSRMRFGQDVCNYAAQLLGLNHWQASKLFSPTPEGDGRFLSNDPAIRAQAGAEHIDRFIERYT